MVAELKGQSVGAGAINAATGELIAQQLYPGVKREDLTEEQKQAISRLSMLAAGSLKGINPMILTGNIRSVAPKPATNDKNHHIFDADGNYQVRR